MSLLARLWLVGRHVTDASWRAQAADVIDAEIFDAVAEFMAAPQGFAVGVTGERLAQEFWPSEFSVFQTPPVLVTLKVKLSLVPAQTLLAEAATRSGCCVPFRVVKTMLFVKTILLSLFWLLMLGETASGYVEQLFVNKDQPSRHRPSMPFSLETAAQHSMGHCLKSLRRRNPWMKWRSRWRRWCRPWWRTEWKGWCMAHIDCLG